jgi:hypothetical protein
MDEPYDFLVEGRISGHQGLLEVAGLKSRQPVASADA